MVFLACIQGWLFLGHTEIQLGGRCRKYSDSQAVFSSENSFVYAGTSLIKTKAKIDLYFLGEQLWQEHCYQ